MNTGITFVLDDGTRIHTYRNLNLRQLADLKISPAEPKRHIIRDIPGVDGDIDITNHFGGVRFKNRTIIARFEGQDQSYGEWCELCRRVENALHGKHANMIILDIDQDYYWEGFVTVSPIKEAIVYSEITITCDVKPKQYLVNG